MTTVRTNWYPERTFVPQFENDVERRLDIVALKVENDIVANFAQGNLSGNKPSRPGQIPAVRTADMKRSVSTGRPGRFRRIVGSRLQPAKGQSHSYPLYLELGTKRMAARPWLRPALARNRNMIKRGMKAR